MKNKATNPAAVTIRFRDIEGMNPAPLFTKLGSKLHTLDAKRAVVNVIRAMQKGVAECMRRNEDLLLIHGRVAPKSWPNGGSIVVDASLMVTRDGKIDAKAWQQVTKDFGEMKDTVIASLPALIPLTLTASDAAAMTVDELAMASLIFDIQVEK